jgi:hypothetical protein
MMSSRSLAAINGVSVISLYGLKRHSYCLAVCDHHFYNCNSIPTCSLRSGSNDVPTSKASREKMRRNKLNDR